MHPSLLRLDGPTRLGASSTELSLGHHCKTNRGVLHQHAWFAGASSQVEVRVLFLP